MVDKAREVIANKYEIAAPCIPYFGINKVDDVEICWWEEGVHYYKPFGKHTMAQVIKKLTKPTKGIYVIGEITSKKHGWVEGAIQSVDSIIK